MSIKLNKPAIIIYCYDLERNSSLNNVLWGIEEEGVPYILEKTSEKCSIKLSHKAAKESKLGVGIGIGNDSSICLHYSKLNLDDYLFKINLNSNEEQLRAIGSNAARLIKGISFKEIL
mgnify:CR=1 FL=1